LTNPPNKSFCLVAIWQPTPLVLGDFLTDQVASSEILGAMATKMIATWRVVGSRNLENSL